MYSIVRYQTVKIVKISYEYKQNKIVSIRHHNRLHTKFVCILLTTISPNFKSAFSFNMSPCQLRIELVICFNRGALQQYCHGQGESYSTPSTSATTSLKNVIEFDFAVDQTPIQPFSHKTNFGSSLWWISFNCWNLATCVFLNCSFKFHPSNLVFNNFHTNIFQFYMLFIPVKYKQDICL